MTAAEQIRATLAEMAEDLALCAEAQTAQADASAKTSTAVQNIENKLGEISDEVGGLASLLRQYIRETIALRAEAQSVIRKVASGER